MDEKKKKERPGDPLQGGGQDTGSSWKASPGLSTPATGTPPQTPPLFDYRTEDDAASTTGSVPQPLTASTSQSTGGEFRLQGSSVGLPGTGSSRDGVSSESKKEGASKVDAAKEQLQEKTSAVGAKVGDASEKLREKASTTGSKLGQSAKSQVDQRKDQVADRLESLQGQLHEKAGTLAEQFTTKADTYLTKASHMLREKNSDELLQVAKDEFRARPLAVAGGLFALGFIGARILRS